MRLVYCVMALVSALALAGCALETALPPGDDLTREPDYRAIVARSIGSIVGDTNKIGDTEISAARRAESFKGAAWLVCVKSSSIPQPSISQQADISQQTSISQQAGIPQTRYHAAFIQNQSVVESRFAVTIDHCEAQPYMPFDWKQKSAVQQEPERKPERGRR